MNQKKLNHKYSAVYIAWLAIGITLFFSGAGFVQAWLVNGELCYALDGSFIMMAISKHLAFDHVWGLTKYHFSSTASSPIFTLLLAGCMLIVGDHIWLPLAINLLVFIGFMIWLAKLGLKWQMKAWQLWFLLIGLVVLAPIPVLLFGSMEHITHIWIAFYCLQQIIENEENQNPGKLFFMGILLAGIRYEGLFEGGLIVLWLWKSKQWAKGFAFGFGMMVPVFALGLYSMGQGWYFLPNSLVLKAYHMNVRETKDVAGYLESWIWKASNHPNAIVAMLVLYLIGKDLKPDQNQNRLWVGFVFWASLLHFVFARYGHVYRYECYLMALSWVVIWKWVCQEFEIHSISGWKAYFSKNTFIGLLVLAFLFSPMSRSMISYVVGTRAMVNIFEQQVQTARFVDQNYNSKTIGALDVGAVAYYSDTRLIDLYGLGELDFAKMKLARNYKPEPIDSLSQLKKVEIAITYGEYMDHPRWKKNCSWVIYNNVVCARDSLHFIAFSDSAKTKMLKYLHEFEPKLPKTISVIYWE